MTLGSSLKRLVEDLDLSERDRGLAALLAVEYADLTTRSLAGEDVASELAHVRAQSDSIVAANAISAGSVLRDGITQALLRALLGLLAT